MLPVMLLGLALAAQTPAGKPVVNVASDQSQAIINVRVLAMSELTYANAFPELGYACSLRQLSGPGRPSAEHAALISPKLASGKLQNYEFSVTCAERSVPQMTFQVLAVPTEKSSCQLIFCIDEKGKMKFFDDLHDPAKCLKHGRELVPGAPTC